VSDTVQPTRIAVAVVEHDGQFLVGIRPQGVPLAGYSEFPGGKVQADESPEQAAVRECLEETGLEIELLGDYPALVHQYDHDRLRLYFFRARCVSQPVDPQPPFQWVRRAKLAERMFPPANDALIAHLLAMPAGADRSP
jgi:8-oxo-dGTP diphosphatase